LAAGLCEVDEVAVPDSPVRLGLCSKVVDAISDL